MPKFEKIKCRIIGRRGTGKSSLINAIAGELIADVGVTGTTMEVGKPYEKREFLFYDLPGYPTEKFPRETYIEKMGIKDSDCVIIVTSDRFYEEELLLIREISKIQPPIAIYAVRTKIDYSIERNKKTGVDEETTLKKIYEELRDNIQDAPVKGIYLTSADYPTAYDLDKLLNDISSNLSEIKKECFTADVTTTEKIIRGKREILDSFREKLCELYANQVKYHNFIFLDHTKNILKDLRGKERADSVKFSYAEEEERYRSVYKIDNTIPILMGAGYHFFMTEDELYIGYNEQYKGTDWHNTKVDILSQNEKVLYKNVKWNKISWEFIRNIRYFPNKYFEFILYSDYKEISVKGSLPFWENENNNLLLHKVLLEILNTYKEDSIEDRYYRVKSEITQSIRKKKYIDVIDLMDADLKEAMDLIEENKQILSLFDYSYPYFYHRIIVLVASDKEDEALIEYRNFKALETYIEEDEIHQKEIYKFYQLKLDALIGEMTHSYYETSLVYDRLKELEDKNFPYEIVRTEKKRNKNYDLYVTHFKELPLQDRNIITISNTDKLFKSDHITLLNIGQLPAINFPMSHPKVNQTYIAHPYKTDSYLPIENYDYELLNDRLNEFFYILQCLGATSITFETIEEENKEEKNHSNLEAEAEAKTKIAGGKLGVEYDSLMNSSLRNYLKMERTQTFDPEKRPYIPKDVVWFPNEFSWQRLAQQRLNGNFLSHNEVLSSSQTQTLSSSEIVDVNAELKMLFTSVKAGVHYQEEKEIKQNRDFSCRISVKFKPMNEFTEENEIIDITAEEVIQTPVQLSASNDNEARYLEEIHFMLEDDGVIDERERTILERLRERYNITPERAKELEAQAIAGQELTSEEQEYLSEYKNSLHDGAISEKERRLLNRLAMALGISEERIIEIEKLV